MKLWPSRTAGPATEACCASRQLTASIQREVEGPALVMGALLLIALKRTLLLTAEDFQLNSLAFSQFLSFMWISMLSLGIGWSMYRYLKGDQDILFGLFLSLFRPFINRALDAVPPERADSTRHGEIDHLTESIAALDQRISELDAAEQMATFSEGDRAAIVETLRERMNRELNQEFLASIERKYGEAIRDDIRFRAIAERAAKTSERLQQEVNALTRRGNLNLVIGTITTLAAVGLLGYIVLNTKDQTGEWAKLLPSYLLRLSLVVFVELFAFFFLRLYRSSLHEIKYFQNELTNVELRTLALNSAFASGNVDSVSHALSSLAQTERNFVLKKGETTTHLERIRMDIQGTKDTLTGIESIIEKVRKE